MDIVAKCNDSGYSITIITTRYASHATELVKEYADEYDVILCSGGDGTVNEIVNGMIQVENKKPIAYLPTGTTNDYGASLGLPREISRCIESISIEEPFNVDVGMLNDKAFVYVACLGTPVKVTYTTPQDEKNTWGYMAYVSELLKTLPEMKPYHLRITVDDRVIEGDYLFAFITNAYQVSGFKGVTGKNVSLNDGLFEITLVKNVKNLAELVIPVTTTLTSDHPDKRYIERFKISKARFECDEEVEWCLDGEFGGRYRQADIRVIHNAVSFLV